MAHWKRPFFTQQYNKKIQYVNKYWAEEIVLEELLTDGCQIQDKGGTRGGHLPRTIELRGVPHLTILSYNLHFSMLRRSLGAVWRIWDPGTHAIVNPKRGQLEFHSERHGQCIYILKRSNLILQSWKENRKCLSKTHIPQGLQGNLSVKCLACKHEDVRSTQEPMQNSQVW